MHDKHNEYPFLCEKKKVSGSKHEKLILDLNGKEKYVLHYLTLKNAVLNGLKLLKVHKILRFKQSKWLQPYIDLNNEKRKNARNEFEENLFKLASNAVFGKTLENVRKRSDIKLYNKWDGRFGAKVNIAKPNFKNIVIFNENLVSIELHKSEIKMVRPIIVGVCILERAKQEMYNFHYDFMHSYYDYNDCKIAYTDTDSFIYYLKQRDPYLMMKNNPDKFDTSHFAIDNPYGIEPRNKKVAGLMKEENRGVLMTKFVGIRPKMYCTKLQNGKISKRAKGVKFGVLKKKIQFEDYLKCLFNECSISHEQATIISRKLKVFSINTTKVMLDPFDDKRMICKNKVDTIAWGHFNAIEKMEAN